MSTPSSALHITFPREQIRGLCQAYGPLLHVPAGVVGSRLLWALSGNESSFGQNCNPRYEKGWDVGSHMGGMPTVKPLLEKYGRAAACSYGPLQVMYPNMAGLGTPAALATSPGLCFKGAVAYINSYVFHAKGARTLDEIAEIYNSGSIHEEPAPGVLKYMADLRQHYQDSAGLL